MPRSKDSSISLRRTIVAAMIIVSFLPMAMVIGVVHLHLNAAFTQLAHENLQSTADRHALRVDSYVRERLAALHLIAQQGDRLLEPGVLQRCLRQLHDVSAGIVDMGLVDRQGIQRIYAGEAGLDMADYSHAAWFQQFLKQGGQDYVSDVFPGLRNSPHFIVAMEVRVQGEPLILRATVDFAQFSTMVRDIRVGESGNACIINRQGEYQTTPLSSPEESGQTLASLARRIFGTGYGARPAQRTLSTEEYLYAFSLMHNNDWVLVLRLSSDDAFAGSLSHTERALYGTLGLFCIAVLCGGLLFAWRLLDRIDNLERERAALTAHLVEAGKLSALGEMAAGIAHEINNPVAIMMEEAGWIDDVLADMPQDANVQEIALSAGKIREQGERCRQITHKLLGFARKSDDPDQAVDIGMLLRELVAVIDQKARHAGVTTTVSVQEALPPVRATPSVLQQVFLNLCNNAVDAMEKQGGSLAISAVLEQDTDGDHPGSFVHVTVQDTGPGMSEEVRSRIFDPFFTTKPVGKGTGLGLSICYGIVNGLGGVIRVESVPGQGTCFHVLLPCTVAA